MEMRSYVHIWLFITAYLGFEYWALDHHSKLSLMHYLQLHSARIQSWNFSTEAGRPMSLLLGWAGIGLMLMTNLYILRKRWSVLKNVGSLPGWLNFHIFCGMLGPSFIVFHSGFKVRGLVAISFWSMMIVALSGVIGRYIYVQIVRQEKASDSIANRLGRHLEELKASVQPTISEPAFALAQTRAFQFVGLPADANHLDLSLPVVLIGSLIGDIRLTFFDPPEVPGWPNSSRYLMAQFAIARRRIAFLEPFRRMLGYWHSFHLPFAFFMYAAAVIHIVSALMFGI